MHIIVLDNVARLVLNSSDRLVLEKILDNISIRSGKRLRNNLFEKRFRHLRIYYLVYLEYRIILVVNIAHKKKQQGIIDKIIRNKQDYDDIAKSKA